MKIKQEHITIKHMNNMKQITVLNATTKKAQEYITRYQSVVSKSGHRSVNEFYQTCSDDKRAAEQRIKEHIMTDTASFYRVIGGNCFNFTCGYIDVDGLHIITKCTHYLIPELITIGGYVK